MSSFERIDETPHRVTDVGLNHRPVLHPDPRAPSNNTD